MSFNLKIKGNQHLHELQEEKKTLIKTEKKE